LLTFTESQNDDEVDNGERNRKVR